MRKRTITILAGLLMAFAMVPLIGGAAYAASYPEMYLDTFRVTITDPEGNVKDTVTRGDKVYVYGELVNSRRNSSALYQQTAVGVRFEKKRTASMSWTQSNEYDTSKKRIKVVWGPLSVPDNEPIGKKQIRCIEFRDWDGQFGGCYNQELYSSVPSTTDTYKAQLADLSHLDFYVTAPLEDAVIQPVPDQVFTGSALTPALSVQCWDVDLVEGTDYDVIYDNNVNAGTAKATIAGKGLYTGTRTVEFQVVPDSISNASVYGIQSKNYTGGQQTQSDYAVIYNGKVLVEDTDYTVSYRDNTNAGTASMIITGKGNFKGNLTKNFRINAKRITPTLTLSPASCIYDGKVKTPAVTVKDGAIILKKDTDYRVAFASGRKNAGSYKVTVTLKGNYSGTASKTFRINKAANTLAVKGKTAAVKYKKLKKKNQTLDVSKVIAVTKKGQGKMTYTLVSAKKGSKNFKKKFAVNKTTGKVTVKKGLKKGTYKVKVKVKAAGNANYNASAWKTVTFKVKVK